MRIRGVACFARAVVVAGLICAPAVASTLALAQTSSQLPGKPWTESPPWGSTARAMAMRVAPPSGGGIVPPARTAIVAPVTAGRNLPPSSSSWSQDTRPKPAAFDDGTRASMRLPVVAQRRVVAFTWTYPAGAIVIVNRERALYHVGDDGKAVRYPVAIGSFTEEWTGVEFVTDKKVNPAWYPVQEPGKEPRDPVQGGDPGNPLGVRALYLGRTLWRIHGTPSVDSIGQAVSSGCIRMHNDHVSELFDRVLLGTEVYVIDRLVDPTPGHRGRKVIE
jgi:lipoprotein-anchoring transpeptidase ErfK/SrfK